MRTSWQSLLIGWSVIVLGWLGVLWWAPVPAPQLVIPAYSDDYTPIEETIAPHVFYGELTGYPHMYSLIVASSTPLAVSIATPVTTEDPPLSGLIVRQERRGVSEVARFSRPQGTWEVEADPWTTVTQKVGPTFEGVLEPGRYLLEVSEPENLKPYILSVATSEQVSVSRNGPVTTMRSLLMAVTFHDKPAVSLVWSPLVGPPLLLLIGVTGWWLWRRRYE